MTTLGCELYFDVEGIIVSADALGKSVTHKGVGMTMRLDLPATPGEFDFPRIEFVVDEPRDRVPTAAFVNISETTFEIRLVRVVVNLDANAAELDDASTRQLLVDMIREATRFVGDFTDWIWVNGQTWYEPRGRYPKLVSSVGLIDLNAQLYKGIQIGQAGTLRILPDDAPLSGEALGRLGERAETGPPELPSLLLAEARHYLGTTHTLAPDRAVLIAAIACEIRVKAVLREKAGPAARSLVDIIVGNPRDVSVAAFDLFHKTMRATVGRSLHEENRRLFDTVRSLFETRNRIVHRGEVTDIEHARPLVAAAVEAFEWLDSVQALVGHDSVPDANVDGPPVDGPTDEPAS
jgi:hypothetical protein